MEPATPVIPGLRLKETIFAKDQPEYKPLPAIIIDERVISRWKFSWRERIKILCTGNLWLTLLTFGKPLQPILLEVDSPKRYIVIELERVQEALP